jgi:multidrug efflux pump subunit AcrB
MTLGDFSVRNPVLVNIITAVILVLGFFSVVRLPQEQFAEVPFFFVNITTPYPGVSAQDVERSVTIPIENEMQGLNRIDTIRSTTTEGLSIVSLEFDQGVSRSEFDSLFQDVRNRFGRVNLPDGVLQGSIEEFSSNDFVPVIEVIVSGDRDYGELNTAARDLAERIRGIKDVSGVTLVGDRDRQITISVNRERSEAIGVSFDEVIRAVGGRNITIPGGTLRTADREYLLRTVGAVTDFEVFRNVIVRNRTGDRGGVVTVGDLAIITDGFDQDGSGARFNGRQSISLRVTKIPGGDSIGIIKDVRDITANFSQTLPADLQADIQIDFFNDSTVPIRDSIDVLVTNAVLGFVLLIIILFFFVGLRNALMTALGIPVTFAVTFIVLEWSGETVNSNTLFGLVLVLGLIVDHAIVIVENSYRLQLQGLPRHQAAIKGVNQVIIPVIAATATTVAAFLPLTFLPGVIGRFLRVVPVTVSIALVASTCEAVFFLPSHYADWPGGLGSGGRRARFFENLQSMYGRVVRKAYVHRVVVVAATFVVVVLSFSLVRSIPPDLFASEDFSVFYIEIEMPPGTPVDRTDSIVRRYEEVLLPRVGTGEVLSINSSVGFQGSSRRNVQQGSIAQIVVDLAEVGEGRTRTIAEIMAEFQMLTAGIAGPEVVTFRKAPSGPPTDPPISFRLFGDDLDQLSAVAEAFRVRLAEYPEVFNIRDNLDRGTPELRVLVPDGPAAAYGLSLDSVGRFIRNAFDGVNVGTVFSANEETDVVVRYDGGKVRSVEDIMQLKIPTGDGRFVPFSSFAVLEEAAGISSIRRLDGRREVTVEAEVYTTVNLPEINAELREYFTGELKPVYDDVELSVGGQFAALTDVLLDILRVFLIGVFAIYAILGTQFKSYTQPFLILFSVPFAFVGVILYLLLSGTLLSSTVIYAGVALAGIAVNDSIVLVSFINELRATGMAVAEATVEAATQRLRPILLTTLTTIAGLVPTAIGLGGESVVWGPMAGTIIFGLIFSTITALLVIPSLYGMFYDRSGKRMRRT